MADESDRVTKNKRIKLPGGQEVLFPVVTRITFNDASDRHQETQHTIDNTDNSDRSVHIAWVPAEGDEDNEDATEDAPAGAEAPDDLLSVERIDIWRAIDAADRHQEIFTNIDNKTKDQDGPPYFTNHLKTHVLRVLNDPDDGSWIETEVIDQFSFLDPSDRNQETIYNLENPPGEPDDEGNLIYRASHDDVEMSGGDSVDPSWRTDPFQNIVKWFGGYLLELNLFWTDYNISTVNYPSGEQPWQWTIPTNLIVTFPGIEAQLQLVSDVTNKAPYTFGQPGSVPLHQPAGYTTFTQSFQYTRLMTFRFAAPAAGQTLTFTGTITAMADYVSEFITTNNPNPGDNLFVTAAENNGPWPLFNIAIKKPRKPTVGDPSEFTYIYQGNTSEGSVFVGPTNIIGGVPYSNWYRTGIFAAGQIEIKLANLKDPMDPSADDMVACWQSKPIMRAVANVNYASSLGDYNLGIYHAFADWVSTGGDGYFAYGLSPEDANIYTGTRPTLPP